MKVAFQNGTILHRTQLMDAQQAESFAKCLAANSRFTAAEVVESTRAKSAARYFVSYAPASEAARLRMLDEQRGQREQRARAEEFTFTWNAELGCYSCLSAKSGRTYETTVSSCSCEDWLRRGSALNLPCKHAISLLEQLEAGEVGEEEALEMAQCEACGEPTAERVTVHAEDGAASIGLCGDCEQQQALDAERAALPTRPVTREEQRKRDADLFQTCFGSANPEWP